MLDWSLEIIFHIECSLFLKRNRFPSIEDVTLIQGIQPRLERLDLSNCGLFLILHEETEDHEEDYWYLPFGLWSIRPLRKKLRFCWSAEFNCCHFSASESSVSLCNLILRRILSSNHSSLRLFLKVHMQNAYTHELLKWENFS